MRGFMIVIGLLVFALFWMVCTPIYFLAQVCDWLDLRLSKYLDGLLDGWFNY